MDILDSRASRDPGFIEIQAKDDFSNNSKRQEINSSVEQFSSTTRMLSEAFGIQEKDITDGLSEGNDLLDRKFSAWDRASKKAQGDGGWFTTIRTIYAYFKTAKPEIKALKAHQELLKNPKEVTHAVNLLASFRSEGVTVDFSQYRQTGLEHAAGTKEDLRYVNGLETQRENFIEMFKPGAFVKGANTMNPAELRESLAKLEEAMTTIGALAKDFDEQRQMVAAVTQNIAREAGIGEHTQEMETLVDQMSSLWMKAAPASDESTPFAVVKFAEKLADELDANDNEQVFGLEDKVSEHSQVFARALITELSNDSAEKAENRVKEEMERIETQIWDSLRANKTFTDKMTKAVAGMQTQLGELNNTVPTTDTIALQVIGQIGEIASENAGNRTGEVHFTTEMIAAYGMPDDMLKVLRGYEGKEGADGVWDRMPMLDILQSFNPEITELPGGDLETYLADTLGVHKVVIAAIMDNFNGDDNTVDIFAAFSNENILDTRRVAAEVSRLNAVPRDAFATSEQAQQSLFKLFKGYSQDITVQYEKALTYLRVEDKPSDLAVTSYDQKTRDEEREEISNNLARFAHIASKGAEVEGFDNPYVESLGITLPTEIDDSALQERLNLQPKDYYGMLSKALGLKEAGTHGSAIMTSELLRFLDDAAGTEDNAYAAYLLLTQGNSIHFKEYQYALDKSENLGAPHKAIQDALRNLTEPHRVEGQAAYVSLPGLENSVTLKMFAKGKQEALETVLTDRKVEVKHAIADVFHPLTFIDKDYRADLVYFAKGHEQAFAEQILVTLGLVELGEEANDPRIPALVQVLASLQDKATQADALEAIQTFVQQARAHSALDGDFINVPRLPLKIQIFEEYQGIDNLNKSGEIIFDNFVNPVGSDNDKEPVIRNPHKIIVDESEDSNEDIKLRNSNGFQPEVGSSSSKVLTFDELAQELDLLNENSQ